MADRIARPGDPRVAAEARDSALASIEKGDAHGVYTAAKWWISAGGGAWVLDPWLLYMVNGVMDGKPRNATHSADMALKTWTEDPADRAVLLWARGSVIMRQLRDPKTAIADLTCCMTAAPTWLRDRAEEDETLCRTLAASSKKSKPSVPPSPAFTPPGDRSFVATALPGHVPGSLPSIWPQTLSVLLPEPQED